MRLPRKAGYAALVVALVGGFEGLRTKAYRDPVGIPTVCFGETKGVKMGDQYTKAQCETMLIERLEEFRAGVDKCLKVPMPDERKAAVVSLAYNIGTGAFCKSTVARKLNAGDVQGGCDAFMMWTKAKGITLPGLVTRRKVERDLCLKEA